LLPVIVALGFGSGVDLCSLSPFVSSRRIRIPLFRVQPGMRRRRLQKTRIEQRSGGQTGGSINWTLCFKRSCTNGEHEILIQMEERHRRI